MKAPSEEIYSESTTCDLLLMVNSKCGRITYPLLNYFAYSLAIFAYCILIVDAYVKSAWYYQCSLYIGEKYF